MDRQKIIKMVCILALLIIVISSFSRVMQNHSMSLSEYQQLQSKDTEGNEISKTPVSTFPDDESNDITEVNDTNSIGSEELDPTNQTDISTENLQDSNNSENIQPSENSSLIGVLLNAETQLDNRMEYADGFYYENLSDNLIRFITGVSYPGAEETSEIQPNELKYVHIRHINFEGIPAEGELICNQAIAEDLLSIFYELYINEYQIEKVFLIDLYNGDDTASMEDNNTSCFNYRVVDGSSNLSKHAYGMAIDINPLYNPYVTYEKDGSEKVSPENALDYVDRSMNFPYKIDSSDLCYKLFTEHGFIWGGNWNNVKDYQHFQKPLP